MSLITYWKLYRNFSTKLFCQLILFHKSLYVPGFLKKKKKKTLRKKNIFPEKSEIHEYDIFS